MSNTPPPVSDPPPHPSSVSDTSSASTFIEKAPGKRLKKDYPPNLAPPPPAPMDTESVIPPNDPVVDTLPPSSPQDTECIEAAVDDATIAGFPRDYVFYERFRAGFEAFPQHFDGSALDKYKALIDPDKLARWERTFSYRQPRNTKAADLRPFLDYYDRMVYPLGNLEGLSNTEFVHPSLPEGCVEDPDLSYLLFEKLTLRRFVAARFPKALQEQPSWTKVASARLEQIDDKLYLAYNELCFTAPGSPFSAGR